MRKKSDARRGTLQADSASNPDPKKPLTTETPEPGVARPAVSDPSVNYVAGSLIYPFIRTDIILAETIDEAEQANGWQIWDDMALDPTLASLQLWYKSNVLMDGLQIDAKKFDPLQGQDLPDEKDTLSAEWARRYMVEIIERLQFVDRPIMATCWDLLDGVRYPHKLAEVTSDTLKYGEFSGMPGFASIRTIPRANYNLIYDWKNTFKGILGIVPGGSIALWSGIVADASLIPNVVAPEKISMFFADDADGIPRSLWNGIYAPWLRLMESYVQMMRTMGGMAGGKVSLVLGEDNRGQEFKDPATGETVTMIQRGQAALKGWMNNGTLTVGPGSTPMVWFPPGTALDGFLAAIKNFQREAVQVITTNAKALLEGEHSSGLSEDKADDDADPVTVILKSKLCQTLNKLFYNQLKLAKGEEFAQRYCPSASMNKGSAPDFADNGATYAQIMAASACTPSQLPDICALVGIRPPNAAEMVVITKAWNAKMDQIQNPPEPSAQPPKPQPKPK